MQVALTLGQEEQYVVQTGSGGALHLPAQRGGQYRLTDMASGLGPTEIVTGRVGNDLHIALAGESILYPSLVLENYFLQAEMKALVGQHGNGMLVSYLPQSAQISDSVHLLAEQMAAVQILQEAEIPAIMAANVINPLAVLAGAGLAGIALTAGNSHNDSRKGRASEQPQTPYNPEQILPDYPEPPPPALPPATLPPVTPPVVPPPANPSPNPPPVNHSPSDLDVAPLQIAENRAGAVVGKVTVTDADQNDRHTFSVSDARFEVVAGELKLKVSEKVEYATEKNIPLVITVTDKAGASYSEDFVIQVQDDPNYPAPAPPNTPNTPATLTITGTPQSGQTLTAILDDKNGVPADVQYRWFADGEPIAGATGKMHTLTHLQVGKVIHVEAVFTDNARHAENPRSAPTASVHYGVHQHAEYGRYLDLREFGADLSGNNDSSAAIAKALATAHQENAALYLGAGILKISGQIKLDTANSGVSALFGDGMGKTTIVFDWQQRGTHNANTNLTDSREFAGILIDGVDGKHIGELSVEYRHQTASDFYRPGESYFGRVNGIYINDASRTTIDQVEVSGANRAGIYFASQRTITEGHRDRLIRGEVTENDVPTGENNQVTNSYLHDNRVAGILFAYQKGFLAENNHLARNGHEKDGGTGYGIASLAGSYNFGITYRGNTTNHNYRKGLDIHDGNDILIENNTAIGDRLYGIAVYNRQFAMNDVTIRGNTIEADPAFRLAVDDGDKGSTRVVEYHGYSAIQIQTNEKFRDLRTQGPGTFAIDNNTIKNLTLYENEQQTYGIEFRNHEIAIDYRLDIRSNRIEGESTKYLIAVINNTGNPQSGEPGPGSGTIYITENTASIGRTARGAVPIYISEANHREQLRGEVHVRDNHISIREESRGDAQFLQFIGNAARYLANDNTFITADNADKPLISLHGHGGADKSVLDVHSNTLQTGLDTLHARWVELGQKNDADASIHADGNTHNGTLLNYLIIPQGESGKTLIISPNLILETFAKLVALDNSQQILDYLGREGGKAFAAPAANNAKHFHGTTGDDILVLGGNASDIIGREGADVFVFVGSQKGTQTLGIHKILDFGNGEDRIRLVAGDGESITNLRFDSTSGILSYDYHNASNHYGEQIAIRAYNGQSLNEDDILRAVQIL